MSSGSEVKDRSIRSMAYKNTADCLNTKIDDANVYSPGKMAKTVVDATLLKLQELASRETWERTLKRNTGAPDNCFAWLRWLDRRSHYAKDVETGSLVVKKAMILL